MKTREEVEKRMADGLKSTRYEEETMLMRVNAELLLDVRDLLIEQKKSV